jgi:hypothetical protein
MHRQITAMTRLTWNFGVSKSARKFIKAAMSHLLFCDSMASHNAEWSGNYTAHLCSIIYIFPDPMSIEK